MTNNPYQAPSSDVNNMSTDSSYDPKVFSVKGRIGRLRYLAYNLLGFLAYLPAIAILAMTFSTNGPGSTFGVVTTVITGISYLLAFIWMIIVSIRRFNDINMTGWLSITMFVPVINLIAGLALLFAPGTNTSNKYGPRPVANSTGVKLAAGLAIFFFIALTVGVIAMPTLLTAAA